MPDPLILASNSLGRRELMTLHGYAFTVRPSHIDEPTEAIDGDIRRYVGELAWRKAAAVAPTVFSIAPLRSRLVRSVYAPIVVSIFA